MRDLDRLAIVSEVVRQGSLTQGHVGHTLVQKLLYLLQEALGTALGYRFRMYTYGPYSGDVWDDLMVLRGFEVLSIEPNQDGYGYRITPGSSAETFRQRRADAVREVTPKVARLLKMLGGRPVSALEAVATAYFVLAEQQRKRQDTDDATLVGLVRKLKPHLGEGDVGVALGQLREQGLVPR